MRSFKLQHIFIFICVTVCFISFQNFTTDSSSSPKIVLPLEVVYPVGSHVSVNFTTTASATSLLLSLHGIEIEDEASVQINNQPAILIDNSTVEILGPGLTTQFPIGSSDISYYNLRLKANIPAGAVTLKFSLNKITDRVSGFRVVNVDLRDVANKSVLPPKTFVSEDVFRWRAPLVGGKVASSADIDEGKNLFTQKDLTGSPLNKLNLQMHCSDCHANDGRDLKYFNYSNTSIIARSLFHGLSLTQAEQIAAYIRSMKTYQSRNARPWNPPYQPKSGLDASDIREWSAGGGITAVLTDQRQMVPYIFPGYTKSREAAITSQSLLNSSNPQSSPDQLIFSNLNIRELPIDLPLPDWNHWLPDVSLRDAVGGDSQYTSSVLFKAFAQLDQALQAGDLQSYAKNARSSPIEIGGAYVPKSYPILSHPGMTIDKPEQYSNHDLAKISHAVSLWKDVKQWEMQNKYDLDNQVSKLINLSFPGLSPLVQQRFEPRGWISSILFSTSSKFVDRDLGQTSITGNTRGEQYMRDSWYWQQLILNPGMGYGCGNNPIDWGYIPGAIEETGLVLQKSQFMRLYAMTVKGMQERDNGIDYTDPRSCGWNPWRLGAELSIVPDGSVPANTGNAMINSLISSYVTKNLTYQNKVWYKAYSTNIDPSFNPAITTQQAMQNSFGFSNGTADFLDTMKAYLSRRTCFSSLRESETTMVKWLDSVYPNIDWTQLANRNVGLHNWCKNSGGDENPTPLTL